MPASRASRKPVEAIFLRFLKPDRVKEGLLPDFKRTVMRLDQPDFKNKRANGRESGVFDGFELLTTPASVALLFVVTFGVVYTALLWKDGAFSGMWDRLTTRPMPIEDRSWMLNGQKKSPKPEVAAPVAPIVEAPPAPQPAPEAETVDETLLQKAE